MQRVSCGGIQILSCRLFCGGVLSLLVHSCSLVGVGGPFMPASLSDLTPPDKLASKFITFSQLAYFLVSSTFSAFQRILKYWNIN